MILLSREKIKLPRQKCSFTGKSHNIMKYNKEEFQTLLSNSNWQFSDQSNDVTEKWDFLLNSINLILDTSCRA